MRRKEKSAKVQPCHWTIFCSNQPLVGFGIGAAKTRLDDQQTLSSIDEHALCLHVCMHGRESACLRRFVLVRSLSLCLCGACKPLAVAKL